MKPTLGSIVFYKLNDGDIPHIDARNDQPRNPVRAGQVYPAQVVAVFDTSPASTTANLIVQLDGYAQYWATSRSCGNQPGQYAWTLNEALQQQEGLPSSAD